MTHHLFGIARFVMLFRLMLVLVAAAFGLAEPACAQLQLPGAVPATPSGANAGPTGAAQPRPAGPRGPVGPSLRRGEETIPGRVLLFLGQQGRMVIERSGAQNYTVAMTGVGRRGNDIRAICTPDLTGGQPITLRPLGRPIGLSRYEAPFPGCRLVLDLLPDSVLVSAPDGSCTFADTCVVDPTGLWGPGDREIPPDREIERARGVAERKLNEARKRVQALLRTTPEGRAFLQEQAGFPANRERSCRNYGTTDVGPGFCALKYTEARAAQLEARAGGGPAESAPAPSRPVPQR